VQIKFINDAYGGSTDADRNLYVDSIAYDGITATNTTAWMPPNGTDSFTVGTGTPIATPPADFLTLRLSEDAWNGDAQFTLSLDGKQVTTPQSVTTLHSSGNWEYFSFAGNFGTGSHTLSVSFVNDAYGGTPSADRNLYVGSITNDGVSCNSGVTELTASSAASFTFTASR